MNDLDISNLGREYPLESLRQQTVLAAFSELALKSDNLDEILTEACRLVGKALGTDLAKVMELQQNGTTLLVRASVGWKPGIVGVVTLDAVQDTSEGYALKTGEPMISPDIATETRFTYPAFLIENGVKAVANVVILGGQDRPLRSASCKSTATSRAASPATTSSFSAATPACLPPRWTGCAPSRACETSACNCVPA